MNDTMASGRGFTCLNDGSDVNIPLSYVLIVSLAFVAACLASTLILTLVEARKVKRQNKLDSARKRASFQASSRMRSLSASGQADLENLYDKINPDYLTTANQDEQDCKQLVYEEEHFYLSRTESFPSHETPNNAELILRELFVPVKEEEGPICDNVPTHMNSNSKREKIKSRIRRHTSELVSSGVQSPPRKFSAVSRSSLSHRDSMSSSLNATLTKPPDSMMMMMVRPSVGSVLDETALMNRTRPRRQALVFTTQISIIGDNDDSSSYSTIV